MEENEKRILMERAVKYTTEYSQILNIVEQYMDELLDADDAMTQIVLIVSKEEDN